MVNTEFEKEIQTTLRGTIVEILKTSLFIAIGIMMLFCIATVVWPGKAAGQDMLQYRKHCIYDANGRRYCCIADDYGRCIGSMVPG